MKILEVKTLGIEDIKVVKFARFNDFRGYFTETFRASQFKEEPETQFLHEHDLNQINESFSRGKTFRGLHFQWEPHMGKLIRTIHGRMIDFSLDIRPNSPTFGMICAYDMPARQEDNFNEWIWLPPGFAHGTLLLEDTTIEYFCSGYYNPKGEYGISVFDKEIDWRHVPAELKDIFDETVAGDFLIKDKDLNSNTLADWKANPNNEKFMDLLQK